MDIINDLVKVDQLKNMEVEETTIRENPAIKCTFPDVKGYEVYFVDDPGDDYWEPRMMTIVKSDDNDINLVGYTEHGQNAYGSDPVALDENGQAMIARVLRGKDFAPATQDDVRDFDDFDISDLDSDDFDGETKMSRIFRESNGDDPNWIVFGEGIHYLNADAVVLDLVMHHEIGKAFMISNLPRV